MASSTLPFDGVVHRGKPWVEKLARVGFAAKAILYFTIGALAVSAALGNGGKATDSRGALGELIGGSFLGLRHALFGRVLLGVVALGLLGYAVWRIIEGITDPERRGTSAKGIALRAGYLGRGLIHLGLAGTAASLALSGSVGSGGDGDRQRHWTARALETPGGVYVLWAVALALLGYGAYQLYKAAKSKLSKQLELGRMSRGARRVVIGVSRFGIAARGIVFGMVGVLLARAAASHDPREAGGVGQSLREISRFGDWPFLVVALGLVAYAVHELVEAKYRRIRVE